MVRHYAGPEWLTGKRHRILPVLQNERECLILQELVLHSGMAINWLGGKPPADEPECGFQNEKCIKQPSTFWSACHESFLTASHIAGRTSEIAGSVFAVLALVGGLIALMLYR